MCFTQLTSIHVERLKKEQREREEVQIKEREERMNIDFAKMLELEIKRKRKETYARWKKGEFTKNGFLSCKFAHTSYKSEFIPFEKGLL